MTIAKIVEDKAELEFFFCLRSCFQDQEDMVVKFQKKKIKKKRKKTW